MLPTLTSHVVYTTVVAIADHLVQAEDGAHRVSETMTLSTKNSVMVIQEYGT